MQAKDRTRHVGIVVKRRADGSKSYQASVWSSRDQRRIRKEFPTLAAAKAWRHDALVALRKGTMCAPTATTLNEAAHAWLEGVRAGTIRNRNGEPYKPSAIRSYARALRLRVLPELGRLKLSAIQRNDVQDLADGLLAAGLDPSTIKNTLNPLQAIFRRAVHRGEVAVNPTAGLDLAKSRGRRDRIASPDEAAALLAALPAEDRAARATAMYAGLRRGELRALRWRDLDLAGGVIRVERAWDDEEGEIEGKSRAARRAVPIAAALRDHLVEHRICCGGDPDALVFGIGDQVPFEPSTVRRRAIAAWKRAELDAIGLHECRHTFASLMIAAGVNAKALSSYMGHASVAITFDRYGHLMPGNEAEAAGLLDAYLERSFTGARCAAGG
jgi:integrase